MKKYLKTPEEVIDALHAGKKVHGDFADEYRFYRGFLIGKMEGYYAINAAISEMEDPYIEESEPLKIEVGKFYKTRGGNKARCFSITPKEASFTVDGAHGTIETYPGGLVSIDGSKDPCDIIGPWED